LKIIGHWKAFGQILQAKENNNDELQICLIELDPYYSTHINQQQKK